MIIKFFIWCDNRMAIELIDDLALPDMLPLMEVMNELQINIYYRRKLENHVLFAA